MVFQQREKETCWWNGRILACNLNKATVIAIQDKSNDAIHTNIVPFAILQLLLLLSGWVECSTSPSSSSNWKGDFFKKMRNLKEV